MRRRFHGLTVEVQGEARGVAAAADLIGALPPEDSPGWPDLRIVLRTSGPTPRPPGPRHFHHGVVGCHAAGDDLLLWDGYSSARVAAGGSRVDVDLAEESLRDGHLFAQVFLLMALVVALRWHGRFHLHAGALVAPSGAGILVAGGAGAGKSTLTLALLESGCAYLGDDAVFLSTHEASAVQALPRPFHVAPRTAAAFPRVGALLSARLASGEKRRLDPRRAWPGRERDVMALPWVLLLPRVSDAPSTILVPLPRSEAMGSLIESSALVVVDALPGREEHLAVLRRVVDGARAFAVESGLDLLASPAWTTTRLLRSVGV